jgi:cobalt transporter subunit CbtB
MQGETKAQAIWTGAVAGWRDAVALLAAAALGLVLVVGAGFAGSDVLHNAAHDARHAAGFPCH